MDTAYETDVVAWAEEQVALLRTGHWALIDVAHIAEEIEAVGKSDRRELLHRLAVLISHLMKWKYQPRLRGRGWANIIMEQRDSIEDVLTDSPSLRGLLHDPDWLARMYRRARNMTIRETGFDDLPQECPWPVDTVLAPEFFPD